MEAENRYLSTAQVAGALGLSVTTVKRWVDDGVLPARKTVGGHRKVLVGDVLRVLRETNLPQADASKLFPQTRNVDLSNPDAVGRQLLSAVKDPDPIRIKALIHGAYQRGFPMDVLADHVIGPVLTEMGRDWEAGRIGVLQEHRATEQVVSSLYELKAAVRPHGERGRPVALGGAPEGDPTLVPTLLAKLVLLDAGWDAINLGPHTPVAAFRTAMDELRPRIVWVCVTHLESPDAFLRDYMSLYRDALARDIAVAVGGRGLTQELRGRMPYTMFGEGMTHLTAFARTLYQRPDIPRRGKPRAREKAPQPGEGN